MSVRRFVDTNVLVYRFDHDEPRKQDRARRLLDRDGRSGSLVLSTQVLQEFYVSVTRKLARKLPPEDALDAVRDLVAAFSIVQIDSDMVTDAISLSQEHGFSLWDALILHAAARGGCREVLTEDLQDGRKILGLEIVNPFRNLDAD